MFAPSDKLVSPNPSTDFLQALLLLGARVLGLFASRGPYRGVSRASSCFSRHPGARSQARDQMLLGHLSFFGSRGLFRPYEVV